MRTTAHPAATEHLPPFIAAPGDTDILFNIVLIFLVVTVTSVMILYFRLHALPEHIAHRTDKVQYQLVAVLALLSLFTHNHVFWIFALLLALVRLPDFTSPLTGMNESLARIAAAKTPPSNLEPLTPRRTVVRSQQTAGE
jgi:multisubunit Na+/H+ antiporter MnhF subunit